MGIITLTTDFGLRDNFVGVMKGVIYRLNPEARLIDITHQIPAHDIAGAGFCLFTAYRYFPPQTVHLAVVDPGVGSGRNMLAVRAGDHVFVTPDNGLLSLILDHEPDHEAYCLTNRDLFLDQPSRTFHGRDIMSPVAAHLSAGLSLNQVGPKVDQVVRHSLPRPRFQKSSISGTIVYVDGFGNLITNIPGDRIPASEGSRAVIQAGPVIITGLSDAYSDVDPGAYLAIKGSAGFLEIARNMAPAERPPDLSVGIPVDVTWEYSP